MSDRPGTNGCVTDCKFCIIHEYGVYVLNTSGLLILVLVLLVYWSEIVDFCRGKVRKQPLNVDQVDSTRMLPRGQDAVFTLTKDWFTNQSPSITAQTLSQPPVIVQQPTILPIVQPVVAPPPPSPSMPQRTNQPKFQPRKRDPTSPASPGPTVNATPSPAMGENDPFRLPTPNTETVRPHESTGTNYFKQVMRGKTPVLSISQYHHKKHDKKPKDGEHQHRHHHHHQVQKRDPRKMFV